MNDIVQRMIDEMKVEDDMTCLISNCTGTENVTQQYTEYLGLE